MLTALKHAHLWYLVYSIDRVFNFFHRKCCAIVAATAAVIRESRRHFSFSEFCGVGLAVVTVVAMVTLITTLLTRA